MHPKPVPYSVAPVRPEPPTEPVVSQPVTVEATVRDRMERAKESVKDAAHQVAEGVRQPLDHAAARIRGKVVTGAQSFDEPYLDLLNKYETVFVIDDGSDLSKADWEKVKAALFQMVPLALLHNAVGGVTVYSASGEGYTLRTNEQVGNYVFKQLQQSPQSAYVTTMVRSTLEDRLKWLGSDQFHPLNLVVVSNRAPDLAAQDALAEAAKRAHGADKKHPLRVQYSVTDTHNGAQKAVEDFANNFAENKGLDPIFDAATIPDGPDFKRLAKQQLVGKIGTWAQDSVAT